MRRASTVLLLLLCLGQSQVVAAEKAAGAKIAWQPWSDDLFERAKRENKFVILDLEAVWCHWCHVMEEKTYSDPKVIALIQSRYLAVRVDQDSRPDLSNRYEDYGWPATIFFSPTGQELAKRAGFFPPDVMLSILQAIIDDPTPGPSVVAEAKLAFKESPFLPADLKKELQKNHLEEYDRKAGGWGFVHKFLVPDSVELALWEARGGDHVAEKMARETLTLSRSLLDPAWGGVYQYSAGGNWHEPHFEKIMQMQADNIRLYSLAYAQWQDPKFLEMATKVQGFLENFLTSPEGAFYTSQDADLIPGVHSEGFFKLGDKQRRAKGIPRIDQHLYTRENGWAATALVDLYMTKGQEKSLEEAKRAVSWAMKNRDLPGGGFRHDADDHDRLYLADTLYMGQAFLRLYAATADRQWLARARDAAQYIGKNFPYVNAEGKAGGFVTAQSKGVLAFRPQRDENVALARFANLLFHYTGDASCRKMAEQAMVFLTVPDIARTAPVAGILLADWELNNSPLHLTIVGRKGDQGARALYQGALAYPGAYKRVEWWDKSEGQLPHADVTYPEMPKAAAFVCTGQRCSLPIFNPEELRSRIDRVLTNTSS